MRFIMRPNLLQSCLALSLGLVTLGLPLAAIAGVNFTPNTSGVPGRREGGGTRDRCTLGRGPTRQLVALVPDGGERTLTGVGRTTDAYPRFFWYMPETTMGQVEFTLYEGAAEDPTPETLVYRATFDVERSAQAGGRQTSPAGVYSLRLPRDSQVAPLQPGKVYRWSVELICPGVRKGSLKAEGGIQRVALNPTQENQLARANPAERVQIYETNGYWFDLLDTLAQQQCTPGGSDRRQWTALMQEPTVNLGAIADMPVRQYCPQAALGAATTTTPEVTPTPGVRALF